MKNIVKRIIALILAAAVLSVIAISVSANEPADVHAEAAAAETTDNSSAASSKAIAAAIIIAAASGAGAIAMGMAISKSSEGISRQPEAAGQIRTGMMLGLVFIETAIIYALIIAILVIFVL